MMSARLRLKKSSGWFAAGQEVAAALEILSDAAFKLYLWLCLHADRHTGRIAWDQTELVDVLQRGAESAIALLDELCHRQVCVRREGRDQVVVEICDRFWPYEKTSGVEPGVDQTSYLQQARQMLLRPACVRAGFSAADERLAATLYRRGVTLLQLQRAIWLGCARKYTALLKGSTPLLVTSLHYFTTIVDEVAATDAGDDYWRYVQSKAAQLERRWIEVHGPGHARSENEMMETK
jgi:hypothetical protein